MPYVLSNSKVTLTLDDDPTYGIKIVSLKRNQGGAHVWTNAQVKPAILRAYDTTTAPATATADFTPTMATRGAVAIQTDAKGQFVTVQWTAIPIGTDAFNLALTYRLNTGEDYPRVSIASASWNGTPTKYAMHAICPAPLAIDPSNSPNDVSFVPAVKGITIDNPIVNHRYDPTGGKPNTPYGSGGTACTMHYPAGRGWNMGYWGYWEKTANEGLQFVDESTSLEIGQVRFESDATRMVFEWFIFQPDYHAVKNNGRALGSTHVLALRPFKAVGGGAWDMAYHYRLRLEAMAPTWLPKLRAERTDLSSSERFTAPFIGIQMLGSAQDAEVAKLPGLIATLRTKWGVPSDVPLVGNVESVDHRLLFHAEPAFTQLRPMMKTLYDSNATRLSNWSPGLPWPGPHATQLAFAPGPPLAATQRRFWTAYNGTSRLKMSRNGRLTGGGNDKLAESFTGRYIRERLYTVSNWNAGTRTLTITGGDPSTDFAGYTVGNLRAVIYPASAANPLAEAILSSLGASSFVIAASPGVFKDSLGNTVTPDATFTVYVWGEMGAGTEIIGGDFCHSAILGSASFLAAVKANGAEGGVDVWRMCGHYQDVYSDPQLNGVGSHQTPCCRDHTGVLDAGFAQHPTGGGDWHVQSIRDYSKQLKDAGKARQVALGVPQHYTVSVEDNDQTKQDVFDWDWHPYAAGRLFRNTTGFDPDIHGMRAFPAWAIVHGGRSGNRGGLNEEFSSAIGSPSARAWIEANVGAGQADILTRFQAYALSEWLYGTFPVYSLFSNDGAIAPAAFADLWDDTIYVAGGGSVPNNVKSVRDMHASMVFVQTRWGQKWLPNGQMMPFATLDGPGTDVTDSMAETPFWAPLYQTYDVVDSRHSTPRVKHSIHRARDGSVAIFFVNWTDTTAKWKGTVDLALHGFKGRVKWRRVTDRAVPVETKRNVIPTATAFTLTAMAPFSVQAIIIEPMLAKPSAGPVGATAGGTLIAGTDLRRIAAQQLGPKLLPATLKQVTTGDPPADNPAGAPPTSPTVHSCRGIVEELTTFERTLDIVKLASAKILLLGGTLPRGTEPQPNDEITIEGRSWTIVEDGVQRDPAGAAFRCYVR